MDRRFPAACEVSPAAALLAWRDGDRVHWQLNDAASTLQPDHAIDWQSVAQAVIDAAERGRLEAEAPAQGVAWRSVALDGGWLAWLLASADRPEPARAVQEAQVQLEMAVRLVGIALWRRNLETRRMQFNERANELLGRPRDAAEMSDQQLWESIHPDDRLAVARADQQALAGHAMVDAEVRCLASDGSWTTLLTRRVAERDAQGRPIALIGVSLDVSEQARERARALEMAQSIELIVDATGVGLWRVDPELGTVWNRQMRRLYGLSDEMPMAEAVPATLERTHPDDRERVAAAYRRLLAGDISSTELEFRIVRADGSERWLGARARSFAVGSRRSVLGVLIDVTERKRGDAIQREKTAAEDANRAKSEFLSRMSHELRTPLNAVLGFARLMLEDPAVALAPKQTEHLKHIRDAGEHLLALIDDVLDLTSVELAQLALASDAVALAPLVGETLQWVAPAAQRAQVMLSQGPLDATVLGDERRLRQVVANLLSNAVKYNRPGGRVDVCVLGAREDHRVGLCVRDTGRGLNAVQLRRLFEPFNRLGAEQNGIEGTGIGLTIVRALVDAMGGRIEVDSTPGVGTEFRVWLPRAPAQPARQPHVAPPPRAPEEPLAELDVLYVEDNAANAALLQAVVELRPNVRLHVARDGRSGVASAKTLRPKLVLLDLELPDIDGYDVLRALQAEPALSGTVFIAVSANAMPEESARAARSGFDDYWTKPIDIAIVLGRLDALARGDATAAQRRA